MPSPEKGIRLFFYIKHREKNCAPFCWTTETTTGAPGRPDLPEWLWFVTPPHYTITMNELYDLISRDIKEDVYYQQNFSNDGQRFLAWYLRSVYQRTPIQAKDDITDGPNDKCIDAVIVNDERREVVIMQGFFTSGEVTDHAKLLEVWATWPFICNLDKLQANANHAVKIKVEAISEALSAAEDYDVSFELVTTGKLTIQATHDLEVFRDQISEYEHPAASITLVDEPVIRAKLQEAQGLDLPLSHTFNLEPGKYLSLQVANFKTVLAAIRLADCLKLPGIHDGRLFRKNVRQFLGTNKVNKGMRQTLSSQTPQYFFLYHNGITAVCKQLQLNSETHELRLQNLNVVNGCQSLTTILACGEKAKAAKDAYILFRFYEIPQEDLEDKVSVNTNSQTAVKARDFRATDRKVIALKTIYEKKYPNGYFITQRGEKRPADRDADKTVEMVELAKCLMTWQCQRPNEAYSENKLFDKYFDKLFRVDYPPADILALHWWYRRIDERWKNLVLKDELKAGASYSRFHLLFSVQTCFCVASTQLDKIPAPSATVKALGDPGNSDGVIGLAANSLNSAFDAARNEYEGKQKAFSWQNWLKTKDSVLKIQAAILMALGMITAITGGSELKKSLVLTADQFSLRWVAD